MDKTLFIFFTLVIKKPHLLIFTLFILPTLLQSGFRLICWGVRARLLGNSRRIRAQLQVLGSQGATLSSTLTPKLGFLVAPQDLLPPENARQASTLCLPCLFGVHSAISGMGNACPPEVPFICPDSHFLMPSVISKL